MSQTEKFSSFFASLMATAGLAIGLGNVWRFPYMMGSYGGSAFLILFVIFITFMSLPALMAEWALARETKQGTIGAFQASFGIRSGRIVGYMLLFSVTVAGGYYLAVIGNIYYSTWFVIFNGFDAKTIPEFEQGLANNSLQFTIAILVLVVSMLIIYLGVRRGIETVSKIGVPFFFLVSIYLVFRVFTLPGAGDHFAQFLKPDFTRIGFTEVFAAMGQAYFSTGLGATLTIIYGSYIRDDVKLPRLAIMTCVGDASAALLAALYLIPALLVFGLELSAGPSLLFVTLPKLLEVLPGGRIFGSLMLLSLGLVILLSYVAVIEAVIGGVLGDSKTSRFSRKQLLIIMISIQALLLIPFTLKPELIPTIDLIFGSFAMLTGGLLAVVALTWGIGRERTLNQVFGSRRGAFVSFYFVWIKWVVPLILIVVLSGTVYEAVL
ncbi:MAG: hypothetical protein GKR93_00340 [Gammaproteobacteria bacterium]|nr:hypothetical protein [Gammaproteobacteria bacterium]